MADERYSKIVRRKGRYFRYDFKDCYLQWVTKDGELIDEVGLHKENWENKGSRNEYIDGWMEEQMESIGYMI